MMHMSTITEGIRRLGTEDQTPNKRGNAVFRLFAPDERYTVDFAPDFKGEGWEQFDTDQDAHYFGAWVNKQKRLTLTYCEGDWTLVVCPDADHYNAEVSDMIRFYGEGYEFKTIGPEGITEYRQDRARFLIGGAA